jgi:hypothetical protein
VLVGVPVASADHALRAPLRRAFKPNARVVDAEARIVEEASDVPEVGELREQGHGNHTTSGHT